MSFNIKGVDISNNNSIESLQTLKDNNVQYVYLKATEGATFKDKVSPRRYNQCKELGLKVGFYHFLVGTSTPEAQAENFYNYIKDYENDLKPSLDVETNFSNLCDYVVRFIDRWKELSNLELCIYTYSSFIPYLQPIQAHIKDLGLWIANYTNNYSKVNTGFFNNVIGWQYSENGTIGNFTGDCNLFNEGCLLNKGEWIKDSKGWWYKHSDGSYTKQYFEFINGEWYYFDVNGYMVTGWLYLTTTGQYYLFDSNGHMYHDCEAYGYTFDSNGHATKIQ